MTLSRAAAEMAGAGVRWIQLRAKRLADRDFYLEVESCCRQLEGSGSELWIDDRADLAALFPVAGLHLGRLDLPASAARGVVGEGLWIGSSTHDEAQLREADREAEVDLIAIGPVFATSGKERPDPVVGVDFVRRARRLTDKPLVAIGGLDGERIVEVLEAGADSAVVLGAICRGDIAANCRRLLAAAGGAA